MRWWTGLTFLVVASACGDAKPGKHEAGAGQASGGTDAGGMAGNPSTGGSSAGAAGRPVVSGAYELLPQELVSASAAVLPDGDIFIYGGLVTRGSLDFPRGAQRYRLDDGAFEPIDGGTDVVQMPSQTYSFLTAAGGVFVIDDQSGTDVTGRLYDVAANSWTELPVPANTWGPLDSALQLANGEVLVIQNKGAQRIDPEAGEWQSAGDLPALSIQGASALLGDGRVLVMSGSSEPPSLYDPEANNWAAATPPRLARRAPALIGLPDGRALLVGGVADSDVRAERTTVEQTELYDADADSWSDGPTLPAAQTTPYLMLLDGDVIAWGGLSFPCETATPCGGRAVSRVSLEAGSATSLPDMSAPGTPLVFEAAADDYLIVLGSSYHRYSFEAGPRKP